MEMDFQQTVDQTNFF